MVLASDRLFASERRTHWVKKTQTHAVQEKRTQRDLERRRMEEYRRLCKNEGITSKRLEEYDARRKTDAEELQAALDEVERNADMTAAEKRRRRFSLKQKWSTKSQATPAKAKASPMAKIARMEQDRQQERERQIAEAAAREKEKSEKIAQRTKRQQLFSMKTAKGQPLMKSRMECLLQKIQQK